MMRAVSASFMSFVARPTAQAIRFMNRPERVSSMAGMVVMVMS